jgi:hypothetical protein
MDKWDCIKLKGFCTSKKNSYSWVLVAIQEAEIRKSKVQSQPKQIVHKTLSQKNPPQKKKKDWRSQ